MLQISPRGSAWVTSDLIVTLLEPTSSGSLTRRPAPVGKDPGNHTTPGPGQGGTDGTAAPACPPLSQLSRAPARPLSLGGSRVRRSPGGVSVWSPLQCDGQTRLGGRPHVSPGPEARSPAVASDTSARVCVRPARAGDRQSRRNQRAGGSGPGVSARAPNRPVPPIHAGAVGGGGPGCREGPPATEGPSGSASP